MGGEPACSGTAPALTGWVVTGWNGREREGGAHLVVSGIAQPLHSRRPSARA